MTAQPPANEVVTSITADEPFRGVGGAIPLLPDPAFLWQIFRRNALLCLLTILVVFAPLAYLVSRMQPTYVAYASLLIEPSTEVVRTTDPNGRQGIVNADEVDTEIRLIGSPLVAERAAKLYAEQNMSADGDAYTEAEIEQITYAIRGTVSVVRSGQTRVADIIARGPDPEFLPKAANALAEAYLQSQVAAKTSQTDATAAFLDARLRVLQRDAEEKQAAVDSYRSRFGLVSSQGSTNAEQEVTILNQQLATARADLAQQQGRLQAAEEQLSRGGAGADVGAALGSGTVTSLRAQEANVSARVAVLAQRYGALHPERQAAEAELNEIRARIQGEINRIISSLRADVQSAQSRVNSLDASRRRAQGRLESTGSAQGELTTLMQEAETAQAVFQNFLLRSQETGALRDSAMPDALISARAVPPLGPSGPPYKLFYAVSSIVALGAGLFAILVAEYLRRGVQTKRDVERRLRLRYAGAIPTLKSTVGWGKARRLPPHEYVLKHPQSIFAESFRSIRAFLTLAPGSRPRAIAISSALPGEGKTTTTLCLALTTANEGVKTLLLDADLRRRGASRLSGFTAEKDIYDFALNGAELKDCIYIDPETGLHVLGSNGAPKTPANPFQEERITKMLDLLRERYDVIIIDTAPLLGVADGRVITTAADRVLLVTRWKKTSMRAVEAVTSMLLNTSAKVTGLALTQVNIRKYASTGDGDVYAYTKQFRGYYQN